MCVRAQRSVRTHKNKIGQEFMHTGGASAPNRMGVRECAYARYGAYACNARKNGWCACTCTKRKTQGNAHAQGVRALWLGAYAQDMIFSDCVREYTPIFPKIFLQKSKVLNLSSTKIQPHNIQNFTKS